MVVHALTVPAAATGQAPRVAAPWRYRRRVANSTRLDAIDLLTDESVRELATIGAGPRVSISMPTHRHGPDTLQGPVRLRQLLEDAESQLREHHGLAPGAIDDLLAPARELMGDEDFWQHQADGLVVYLAPDRSHRYRVPAELPEGVVVGQSFRLRPLVPLLDGDGRFHILSLSQEEIRLFEASRLAIREIELTDMPTSIDEALAQDDPDGLRARHGNASANGRAHLHGHGGGSERDKHEFERYVKAVDAGIRRHIGEGRDPLVLACLGHKVSVFRSLSKHPNVLPSAVEGNPVGKKPAELHAAAWELVAPHFAGAAARDWERYQQLEGEGGERATCDIVDVIGRANEGRVETLFVTQGGRMRGIVNPAEQTVQRGDAPGAEDLVDAAITLTVRNRGTVHAIDADRLPLDCPVAAVLRY